MASPDLVHIVDDDAAVRDSLAMLLQSHGLDVLTYDSAAAFLTAVDGVRTGCVLLDVRMPGTDGLTLQRDLANRGFTLPVIVMTGHGDVPIAVAALKTGASDFLEKPFDDTRLLEAVRNALSASAEGQRTAERLANLTPREREVLDRLVDGQPNKTIAFDLGTSPRTVEVHRGRVMDKMGARSLPDLVRMVLELRRLAHGPRG